MRGRSSMATIIFTQDNTGVSTTLTNTKVMPGKIVGVESTPTTSVNTLKLSGGDGEKVISTSVEPRSIIVEGVLTDTSSALLRLRLDALKRDVSGSGVLEVLLGGELYNKRYNVQVTAIEVENKTDPLTHIPFSIQLTAFDPPFAESIDYTVYSASGINADLFFQISDLVSSAEPGMNFEIALPTIGNLTGIELRNNTTSMGLLTTPSFVANDVLVIDTIDQSVLLNGLPVDFTGQVPKLSPRDNDVRLTWRTTAVTIDVQQLEYTMDKYAFGDIWLAQSFEASGAISASRVDLLLSRQGLPSEVWVEIMSDSSGPDTSLGISRMVAGSTISTTPTYVSFELQNAVALSSSTTYWIVLYVSGDVNDVSNGIYWKVSGNNPYADGQFSRSTNTGSTWTAESTKDAAFKVWKTAAIASNVDVSQEQYVEDFSTTTFKDAGATTANWDTVEQHLVLGGGTETLGESFTGTADTSYGCYNGSSSRLDAAQSFQPQIDQYLSKVSFMVAKAGSPTGSFCIDIQSDNAGAPSGLVLATSAAVNTSALSASPAWQDWSFSPTLFITANTTYWAVLRKVGGGNVTGEGIGSFEANTNDTAYTRGTFKSKSDTGVWQTTGNDALFRVYYINYNTSLNIGQSSAYNGSNAAFLATVNVQPTETLPASTSTAYQMQSDSTTGFVTVPKNIDTNLSMPALNATPSHKWKATLTGTIAYSPDIGPLTIAYRKAMPLNLTTDRIAQRFNSGAGGSVSSLLLNLVKSAADNINYTVRIETESGGTPSGSLVTNGSTTIAAANVPNQAAGSGFSWVQAVFSTPPSLTASTPYWIVISVASAGTSKLLWRSRGANSYSGGNAAYSVNSGAGWTTMTDEDFLFQVLTTVGTFAADVTAKYNLRWK